jgi:hypothetical protein
VSSPWRWTYLCVQGIGQFLAEVNTEKDWGGEGESDGRIEIRRITASKRTDEGITLHPWDGNQFFEGTMKVRPWAVLWTAAPTAEMVRVAEEQVWSKVQRPTPGEIHLLEKAANP